MDALSLSPKVPVAAVFALALSTACRASQPSGAGAASSTSAAVAGGTPTVASAAAAAPGMSFVPVALPGSSGDIGFDDLTFAPRIRRVLAPAGRTGKLDLIDPSTREVVAV